MPLILEFLGTAKEIPLVGTLLQLSPQPQQQGPQDGAKDATKKNLNPSPKWANKCHSCLKVSAQYPWNGVAVVLF